MIDTYRVPVVVLIFSALLAACGQGGQQQAKTGSAPAVSVVTIEPQKLTLSTLLPGRTAPMRIAEIRPQVNGLIQRRLFTEGSEVKAGQVLYQIEPAPFQAALDTARAGLTRAEASRNALKAKAERKSERGEPPVQAAADAPAGKPAAAPAGTPASAPESAK